MIQSLSSDVSLLHQSMLSQARGSEGPGEAENDGDSDDGQQASGASLQSSTRAWLPDYLGNQVNTLA